MFGFPVLGAAAAPPPPTALPPITVVSAEERAEAKTAIEALPLKDLLASWQRMVEEQRRGFHEKASQVANWDVQLRRAHVDLHDLECSVGQLTADSDEVDKRLSAIEEEQNSMEAQLRGVEERLETLLRAHGASAEYGEAGTAQRARMGAYTAAQELNLLLNHLEDKLDAVEKEMREEQLELNGDSVR